MYPQLSLALLPSPYTRTWCILPVSPIQGEEAATLGAGLGEGSKIGGKPAVWVITAAIKGALLFA